MGTTGKLPSNPETLRARGSKLARHPNAKNHVTVEPAIPATPAAFGDAERALWGEVTAELHAAGIIGLIDANLLERYVAAFHRWRQCEAAIRKHGTTVELKFADGRLKGISARPEVAIGMKLDKQLLAMEREFGMTPAARARIAAPTEAPPENEINARLKARFFTNGQGNE